VDLSLPASGETHITRRIRARYPDMKLIILSVHDDAAVAEGVLSAGAAGFVLKRSAGEDLLAAVDSINENKVFVSPEVKDRR
jgi:DNA-binding NarL/FixJ family response regulator